MLVLKAIVRMRDDGKGTADAGFVSNLRFGHGSRSTGVYTAMYRVLIAPLLAGNAWPVAAI